MLHSSYVEVTIVICELFSHVLLQMQILLSLAYIC
jgi:hypothetical protein